jgi:hypothetical protein
MIDSHLDDPRQPISDDWYASEIDRLASSLTDEEISTYLVNCEMTDTPDNRYKASIEIAEQLIEL